MISSNPYKRFVYIIEQPTIFILKAVSECQSCWEKDVFVCPEHKTKLEVWERWVQF